MKLSLSFNEENNQSPPQLKAKLPISIFNQPFTSIFTTSTTTISSKTTTTASSSPTFSLSTNFPTGPSLRSTYTPTPTTSTQVLPFSLSLKSGLGLFGSPNDSPLVFTAHFALSKTNPSSIIPTFSLHFKPQLGHFSLNKKTHSSSSSNPDPGSNSGSVSQAGVGLNFDNGSASNSVVKNGFGSDGPLGWQDVSLEPFGGDGKERKGLNFVDGVRVDGVGIGAIPSRELVRGEREKDRVFGGVSVMARTVLPLTERLVVNFKWGVNASGNSSFGTKMPCLTLNKIGIERIQDKEGMEQKSSGGNSRDLELLKGLCFWMRRDLEVLEEENKYMKRSLENIRTGISAKNVPRERDDVGKIVAQAPSGLVGEFEQRRSKKIDVEGNVRHDSKKPENHLNDLESELQKAIKAASS